MKKLCVIVTGGRIAPQNHHSYVAVAGDIASALNIQYDAIKWCDGDIEIGASVIAEFDSIRMVLTMYTYYGGNNSKVAEVKYRKLDWGLSQQVAHSRSPVRFSLLLADTPPPDDMSAVMMHGGTYVDYYERRDEDGALVKFVVVAPHNIDKAIAELNDAVALAPVRASIMRTFGSARNFGIALIDYLGEEEIGEFIKFLTAHKHFQAQTAYLRDTVEVAAPPHTYRYELPMADVTPPPAEHSITKGDMSSSTEAVLRHIGIMTPLLHTPELGKSYIASTAKRNNEVFVMLRCEYISDVIPAITELMESYPPVQHKDAYIKFVATLWQRPILHGYDADVAKASEYVLTRVLAVDAVPAELLTLLSDGLYKQFVRECNGHLAVVDPPINVEPTSLKKQVEELAVTIGKQFGTLTKELEYLRNQLAQLRPTNIVSPTSKQLIKINARAMPFSPGIITNRVYRTGAYVMCATQSETDQGIIVTPVRPEVRFMASVLQAMHGEFPLSTYAKVYLKYITDAVATTLAKSTSSTVDACAINIALKLVVEHAYPMTAPPVDQTEREIWIALHYGDVVTDHCDRLSLLAGLLAVEGEEHPANVKTGIQLLRQSLEHDFESYAHYLQMRHDHSVK